MASKMVEPNEAPPLTIGIPVYNGANTLSRALDSLLAQEFQNFLIHISDNASTDGTWQICSHYASLDERIHVSRTACTVPPVENFARLLREVPTKYFMFAAADDFWHPSYTKKNIENLELNPDAVASVSKVLFVDGDIPIGIARGTTPLIGTALNRLRTYLPQPEDNSRFYGVYRTPVLQHSFSLEDIVAFDWLISAQTLLCGNHLQVDEVLMERDRTLLSGYRGLADRLSRGIWSRSFPALPMALIFARRLPIRLALQVGLQLLQLTWRSADISPYARVRHFRKITASISSRLRANVRQSLSR